MHKTAEQEKIAMVKSAEVRGVLLCLIDHEMIKVASEEDFEAVADMISEKLADDYGIEEVLDEVAAIIEADEELSQLSDEEKAELLEAAAEEVIEGEGEAGAEEDMVVEASYKHGKEKRAGDKMDTSTLLDEYSELVMAKHAGEISDAYFEKRAASIKGVLDSARGLLRGAYNKDLTAPVGAAAKTVGGKAQDAGQFLRRGLTGKGLRDASRQAQVSNAGAYVPNAPTYRGDISSMRRRGLLESGVAYGGIGAAGAGAYGLGRRDRE